jgi:hypothetical protein
LSQVDQTCVPSPFKYSPEKFSGNGHHICLSEGHAFNRAPGNERAPSRFLVGHRLNGSARATFALRGKANGQDHLTTKSCWPRQTAHPQNRDAFGPNSGVIGTDQPRDHAAVEPRLPCVCERPPLSSYTASDHLSCDFSPCSSLRRLPACFVAEKRGNEHVGVVLFRFPGFQTAKQMLKRGA